MPDVRSQPEPRASSKSCATPGHRSRRRTQHQAPPQGFTLRPRPSPSVSRHHGRRINSRALSQEQHAYGRVYLCAPCLRASARCHHCTFGAGTERCFAFRTAPVPFVRQRHPFARWPVGPASGRNVGLLSQAPPGFLEAIRRHAWRQSPSSPHKPSCGLTSACSGLAALAADARRYTVSAPPFLP